MGTSAKTKALKKRKRRIKIISWVIAIIVFLALALFLTDPLTHIIPRNEPMQIRIGYSRFAYPPLHYFENDELVGFDVELAKSAAAIMNAEAVFVPIDWSNAAGSLESGEVDLLWGGLEYASLDEQIVRFTTPYLSADIVLLMPEDGDYAALEDLRGLNVCALNFTPAFAYLKEYDRNVIRSRRSFTPTDYRELLGSLSSGEYDCIIADTNFASFFLRVNGADTYTVSEPVLSANFAVGARTDDGGLFDLLQSALDELQANGAIDALISEWIAG